MCVWEDYIEMDLTEIVWPCGVGSCGSGEKYSSKRWL